MRILLLAVALSAYGCGARAHESDNAASGGERGASLEAGGTGTADGAEAGASSAEASCRTDKIAFSQATGCQNDNSVEFCLAANDSVARSQVMDIAPNLACEQGSRGRAGCEPETEQLCQLPIAREHCPMDSPMPDALWLVVCRLAALDAIAQIVPTWYG